MRLPTNYWASCNNEAEEDESVSLLNEYFTAASRRSGQAEAIEAGKKVLDKVSGEEPTTDSSDSSMGAGDLQMILKMCVPPSDILKLVTGK
jgi:hypothetical protein